MNNLAKRAILLASIKLMREQLEVLDTMGAGTDDYWNEEADLAKLIHLTEEWLKDFPPSKVNFILKPDGQ